MKMNSSKMSEEENKINIVNEKLSISKEPTSAK
jgi:hypothetical protein